MTSEVKNDTGTERIDQSVTFKENFSAFLHFSFLEQLHCRRDIGRGLKMRCFQPKILRFQDG